VTTALGKVVRTTAFKLSAIYIAVFSVFSVFFVVYIAYSTNVLLNQQVRETIGTELVGLSDQYRVGGLSALIDVIDQRAHQPGASLYLMTDADGHILAGNVSHVTGDVAARSGIEPITVTYHRSETDSAERTALVQVISLPGDFLLLVGRDIGERAGLGAGADDRARRHQLPLRQPQRAEAHRLDIGRRAADYAGRPCRPPGYRGLRR